MNSNIATPTKNVTQIRQSQTSSLFSIIIEINGIGHKINIFSILSVISFVPSNTKFYSSHFGYMYSEKILLLTPAPIANIIGPIKKDFK